MATTTSSLCCLLTSLILTGLVMPKPGSALPPKGPPSSVTDPPPAGQCPDKCQCSKGDKTVYCNGKGLTTIPANLPPLVEVLYLEHNSLVSLQEGALYNLTHLTKVWLRNNQIQTFHPGAFCSLPQLSELYLTNNNIARLHPNTFQGVDALTLLNLGANKLTSVPDLHSLPGLKKLYLDGNQIRNATFPDGYSRLKTLNSIVLSTNNITSVTNETFKVLTNSSVRRLELTRNGLKNVSVGAFSPLGTLQSLKIGLNPLDGLQLQHVLQGLSDDLNLESLDISRISLGGTLPSFSFSILSRTSLKTLLFKNNKVRKIPERAFADLPKLVQLDLSHCQVQEVTANAFVDLPDLTMLLLSYNQDLSTVPKNLPGNLQKLYLQYDKIDTLQGGAFSNLGHLRELYLSNNNMDKLSEDSFVGLESLSILHLQNNRLSYIPKKLFVPLPNLATLDLQNNNIKSLKPNPGAMASLTALTTLDMSNNQCSYIPFDYFTDLTSLQNLYLDGNLLGGLLASDSRGILLGKMRKLRVLGLSNNNISYIHDAQFSNLNGLQHVNLKNNRLSSWGPKLFYTPGTYRRTLRTVDLSGNLIALVNKTSVRDLEHVKTLNLSLNPFACTCDLRWFRTWLDNTTVDVANKTTYKCNSPQAWNGKPLLDFGPDKINCIDFTWYYVGAAIAATLIIAVVICYIIHRHRWFIRLRFYRLGKSCGRCCCQSRPMPGYDALGGDDVPGDVKRYDFYVIAAEKDTRWVVEKLLPILDKGPVFQDQTNRYTGQFTLFFEDRDMQAGMTMIANYDVNMPASQAVLIVLTRELGKDSWCNFLLEQAFSLKIDGKIDRIEIIMVGDVPPRYIPRCLHRAIENGQYKKWLERDTVEQDFVDYLQNALQQGQQHGQQHVANHVQHV